jgi:predicted DNA-binding transcriptional regulator YafY
MDPVSEIRKAAKDRVLLEVEYKNSSGEVTTRLTEPYELRGDSYFGFDVEKDGIRNFKLSSILSASATIKPFVARWPIKIS